MRTRTVAFVALFIAFLCVSPAVFYSNSNLFNSKAALLANSSYTENLSVYLTSTESLWMVHLSGGSINVSSVVVPNTISGYSISLTNYQTWQSSFEVFTKYGFGILGNSEPYPNGALLVINGTSPSDAVSLATSLSDRFGLAFVETSSSSISFTFFSPINYVTEVSSYFYALIPQSAGGFATMFGMNQIETNSLNYFQMSYHDSTYSLSFGGLSPLSSSSFNLYGQLGLSKTSYNYSSVSTSSTIDVYVLDGLVINSSEPYTNHVSNISSTIELQRSSNMTVPEITATLNFSFPTILALRQVTSLTPSTGSSVTVTIAVTNLSPPGGAIAENVFVNDSWIYSQTGSFNLTHPQTSNNETLAPGASYTVVYAFTVTATNGSYVLPATKVTYAYSSPNGTLLNGETRLNSETLDVGVSNTPELEATASIATGTQISVGGSSSINITITNKGNGAAFSLASDGLSKSSLAAGESWSFISNDSIMSLTQVVGNFSFTVKWQDASGAPHSATSNAINTVLSYASPGTPSITLSKAVSQPVSSLLNVTLTVSNNSPSGVGNSLINDTIPQGMAFVKSYNESSVKMSGQQITANLSSVQSQVVFVYELNVSTLNNYVFPPAIISSSWGNETIKHYSGGEGLPLGVQVTKEFSPSAGFQGSNTSLLVKVVNNGNLPIYNINVSNSFSPFLQILVSKTNSTTVLTMGSVLTESFIANLTGSPGEYNSSDSTANFIFAGSVQNASSSVSTINIFHLPEANITYTALKVEEGHDIIVTITVTNPSNFTLTNISYTLSLPKNLKVVSGGETNFTVGSLGPGGQKIHNFTILTSLPYVYQLNNGKLTFEYQGHQLNGIASELSLNINDDIPIRYGIPGVIGIIIVAITVLYVRRLTSARTMK